MSDENIEIAPLYSFKPIDMDLPLLDNSTSNDSLLSGDSMVADLLPAPIFREVSNADCSDRSPPLVRQANPINDPNGSASTADDDVNERADRRVISPYPFSHTSQEEIKEREQLSREFNWTLDENRADELNGGGEKILFQFDYTRFFDQNDLGNVVAMDCDDFSVSSEVSDDLCLESMSENPSSFWGDEELSRSEFGNESLSRVSLES